MPAAPSLHLATEAAFEGKLITRDERKFFRDINMEGNAGKHRD